MLEASPYMQIGVSAAPDCKISPFSSLENVVLHSGARIADGAQLKNAVVGSHTKIGRNVTLYSSEPNRPVRIGHHCWLSAGVFGEGTGGEIEIGDYAVIAHATTILTSSGPGEQSPIMSSIYPVELGPVRIQSHVWIGAHCVLLPGVFLAEGVVAAAISLFRKGYYEAWSVYGGSPARLLKQLDPRAVRLAREQMISNGEKQPP